MSYKSILEGEYDPKQWDVKFPDPYPSRRYGRLVVQSLTSMRHNKQKVFRMLCDCGRTYFARKQHLREGRLMSCGCFRSERMSRVNQLRLKAQMDLYGAEKAYRNFKEEK